jgi:hypothetical protein
MHAFSKEVGIPLRPYLRWLKLERAGSAIATGATLSDAAYAAGFADAAHMTRTFKGSWGSPRRKCVNEPCVNLRLRPRPRPPRWPARRAGAALAVVGPNLDRGLPNVQPQEDALAFFPRFGPAGRWFSEYDLTRI